MQLRDLIGQGYVFEGKINGKTFEEFWDVFTYIWKQTDARELKWDLNWLMLHYGCLFPNNIQLICESICKHINEIGIDNVKTMLRCILFDEFKGVFKMHNKRVECIRLLIKLVYTWNDILSFKNGSKTPTLRKLITKLENIKDFNITKYHTEISYLGNKLSVAVNNNCWDSAINCIKAIINLLLREIDEN